MPSQSTRIIIFGAAAAAVASGVWYFLISRRGSSTNENTKTGTLPKDGTVEKESSLCGPPQLDRDTQEAVEKCISLATSVKQKGNVYLQANKLEEALTVYQQGLDLLSHIPPSASQEAHSTRLVIGSNCVLCLLKMESFDAALMLATDLLQDPTGGAADASIEGITGGTSLGREMVSKILFRRSQALEKLGQVEAALSDLEASKELTQNVASKDEISAKLASLRRKL